MGINRAVPVIALMFTPDSGQRGALWVVLPLLIISGLWSVGAVIAVRDGEWLRLVYWMVLWALPLVRIWRALHDVAEYDAREWLRSAGIYFLVGGSAVAGVIYLTQNLDALKHILTAVSIGLLCLMAIVGLGAVANMRLNAHRDRNAAALDGVGTCVHGAWLAGKLAAMRLSGGVELLLHNLRTASPKPEWSGDAMLLLGAIGRSAEQYRTGEAETRVNARSAFNELWKPYGIDTYPGLDVFARPNVLDEVGKIEDESRLTG
jgi:hypothetical protein